MASHHMAHMHLGSFVFGHVKNLIALGRKLRNQCHTIFFRLDANADVNMRLLRICAAVVEFRYGAFAEGAAELQKTALGLIYGDR